MTPSIRTLRTQAGFTIPELMVSVVMSLLLGVAGFAFLRAQLRSLTDQSASLDAIEGTRAALDVMAHDIRMAGAIPTGACASCGSGLSNASANGITVAWDANANGTLDAGESITYSYDSSTQTILRTVSGSSAQALIKNVPAGGLAFQYLQFDGTSAPMSGGQVTNPAGVASIKIAVQVQAARATTVTTTTLQAKVGLRNRAAVLARL
jgi:type II secretory pathway component PulJ